MFSATDGHIVSHESVGAQSRHHLMGLFSIKIHQGVVHSVKLFRIEISWLLCAAVEQGHLKNKSIIRFRETN